MVKTPWFDYEIPFHQAAETGTRKVIEEHSSIGLVITCDGSFGEIPRENYIEGEEKTVQELKKTGKPFLILVNSQKPYKEETQNLVQELKKKYQAGVISVNCEQLRKEDVTRILEKILYEFPIVQMEFYVPQMGGNAAGRSLSEGKSSGWYPGTDGEDEVCKDAAREHLPFSSEYVRNMTPEKISLLTAGYGSGWIWTKNGIMRSSAK